MAAVATTAHCRQEQWQKDIVGGLLFSVWAFDVDTGSPFRTVYMHNGLAASSTTICANMCAPSARSHHFRPPFLKRSWHRAPSTHMCERERESARVAQQFFLACWQSAIFIFEPFFAFSNYVTFVHSSVWPVMCVGCRCPLMWVSHHHPAATAPPACQH